MKGNSTRKNVALKWLLRVTRLVNHSRLPNTRCLRGCSCEHLRYRTIRLQNIRNIGAGEDITVDYGNSFFGGIDKSK